MLRVFVVRERRELHDIVSRFASCQKTTFFRQHQIEERFVAELDIVWRICFYMSLSYNESFGINICLW